VNKVQRFKTYDLNVRVPRLARDCKNIRHIDRATVAQVKQEKEECERSRLALTDSLKQRAEDGQVVRPAQAQHEVFPDLVTKEQHRVYRSGMAHEHVADQFAPNGDRLDAKLARCSQ